MRPRIVHVELVDKEVIGEVLNGNVDAYNKLIDKYKSYVFTITYKILNNKQDAEEAAQDSFIKGYQALSSFNGQSKYSTWLYRIAFNTSISYKRKRKIEVSGLDALENMISTSENATSQLNKQDQRVIIERAMLSLSPIDATIVTLFYLKEHNLEEISKITGHKISSIKVKLFRSRKKLADELKNRLLIEAETIL